MKNKSSSAIWGLILIIFGISIAGKSLNLFYLNIFFDGWWTLFIIIPCFIKLCNRENGNRTSNMIGLCIGIMLLLNSQGILNGELLWPIFIAGMFIMIGGKMIFGDSGNHNKHKKQKEYESDKDSRTRYYQEDIWEYTDNAANSDPFAGYDGYGSSGSQSANQSKSYDSTQSFGGSQGTESNQFYGGNQDLDGNKSYSNTVNEYEFDSGNTNRDTKEGNGRRGNKVACSAIFSGKSLKFDNESFNGGMFSVIFGGIDIDLRHAVIRDDVYIETKVIFGGMEILVPDYVRVVTDGVSIMGGVDCKVKGTKRMNDYIPTIYINSTCIFGGIDVK